MAIENEIVHFTAKVDMDEQTAKAAEQAFSNLETKAGELRHRIEEANAALMKMRMEGKEGTDQFKALEASMQADIKALKQTTKEADKYASSCRRTSSRSCTGSRATASTATPPGRWTAP